MRKFYFLFFIFYSCANIEYSSRNDYSLYCDKYPDYGYVETTHFIVNSSDLNYAKKISDMAERYYYSFMMDTNLFSFVPASPYRIIIHNDYETFIKKTNAKQWSGGFISSNTIETFISSNTECVIAHEITHLILNEYMGDMIDFYKWLNEGLATYEERKGCYVVDERYNNLLRYSVLPNPWSLNILVNLNPSSMSDVKEVEKFYAQSSDIIKFMIEKEGPFKFYLFICELKKGSSIDDALKNAYPSSFNSLSALEKEWLSNRVR